MPYLNLDEERISPHKGFIRIHRKSISSAIWKNINDWRLAETILLLANWKPGDFQSRGGDCFKVHRGELVTSLKTLCSISRLSSRTVRTSLEHLRKSEFLTSRTTNHFSVIKVINYARYQDHENTNDKPSDKHPTSTRQAPDKHPTTIEEGKEVKEVNKEDTQAKKPASDPRVKTIIDYFSDSCLKTFGFRPDFNGQDGAMVKSNLAQGKTEADIKAAIDFFLNGDKAKDCGIKLSSAISAHSWNCYRASIPKLMKMSELNG